MQRRSPDIKTKQEWNANKTTNCSRLALPARNSSRAQPPQLGLQHWPLVPAGRVSNEWINNSLVMNPAAHNELPTEHRQGLKSCESAKGSLELYKNCNWMELGEQNKLIKSFHWQNHCYRNFRWIMDLPGILNTNWPTFFKRLCWFWWMKEVGFVTDTQDSKSLSECLEVVKIWAFLSVGTYWHSCRYCRLQHKQGYKVGMPPCEERLSFDYLLGFQQRFWKD